MNTTHNLKEKFKGGVLHISALYDSGGAAYIARMVHEGCLNYGIKSKFIAGYSQTRTLGREAISLHKKKSFTTVSNYISHSLVGIDLFSPNKQNFQEKLEGYDFVIVHTIHSYWTSYRQLFLLLNENYFKKIIFVAHDSWHYTGRCAFRFNCEMYKTGCESCNNKNYYPKTKLSFSKKEFRAKTDWIKKSEVHFVTPARWIKNDLNLVYPKLQTDLIRNGIDTHPFISLKTLVVEPVFLVSSVNLSQPGKHNWDIIKLVLDLGYIVHFVGKNNPLSSHPNAINHGFVKSRKQYIEILSKTSCYLFTSKIDIYPTVIVEAFCAGSLVIGEESRGLKEFEEEAFKDCIVEIHSDSVKETLSTALFLEKISNVYKRKKTQKYALKKFHRDRMVNDYLKVLSHE